MEEDIKGSIQPKKLSFTEWGNPILSKKLKPVSPAKVKSKALQSFIKDMFFTMSDIGYGIAANQVNKDLHLAVVQMPAEHNGGVALPRTAIINPKILEYSKEKAKNWEGCLSCPGVRGLATRSKWIRVSYWDENGKKHEQKLAGWPGIIFQHEIDHLNGIRYAERIEDMKNLITDKEYAKRWMPGIIAEMKRANVKNRARNQKSK